MQSGDLRRALGCEELDELGEFLAGTPEAMLLPRAHGFLTAIASAPTTVMPSVWQPAVLGNPAFDSMEQAQRVLGLMMRLYNQILTELNEHQEFTPPNLDDDDSIRLWCIGYLEAARMDDVWIDDEHAHVLLFPFAILAGEVDLVGEEDDKGEVITDPTPQLRRCRASLGATVLEANRYWTAWRRNSKAVPIARASQKVGRNEICPCGSGLKFKKCCALKVH